MHLNLKPPPAARQAKRPRPPHPRDEYERRAEHVFDDLLDSRRRSRLDKVRHYTAELASLGFRVEDLGGGLRMVPVTPGPDVLLMHRHGRMPVAWFGRLVRAIAESDSDLESRAIGELAECGYRVEVDPANRRRAAR